MQEAELIARIQSGDKELYAELVRAHEAHLFRLCLAILRDPAESEEAAQQAFIKAYRFLGRFRGESSFRTWLTRIGVNCCKDLIRQRMRRRSQSLDALLETPGAVPEGLIQLPTPDAAPPLPPGALRGLTEGERAVMELVIEDDTRSYADLAASLGLSVDSVKGRLKRARQKLQRILRP